MREPLHSSEVSIDLDLGTDPDARTEARRSSNGIFRIAVCGDFSARQDARGAWRIDRDDFDDVLAAVAPTLQLTLPGGGSASVRLRELDDFHPDRLFLQVPQFAPLRELRGRLADPSTFRRAADQLKAPPPVTGAPRSAPLPTSGSLLDAIVGETLPPPPGATQPTDDLYAIVQRAMAPHLVDRPDPRQAELVAQADASIAAIMRDVLHHPSFQAMEALWRGVYRMVRDIDTTAELQIHLVDCSREALTADLLGAADPRATQLYRRLDTLADDDAGGWGVLVAHYAFGALDLPVLERLAALGEALDAPWIAEANPDLALGTLPAESATAWTQLRGSPRAGRLALALPRILLRLPYGEGGDTCERFAFEELLGGDEHGSYLWGNPALFCATSLAQGFSERGSGLAPGEATTIERLPLHLVRKDGAVSAKPCAEVLMGLSDAETLIDGGFIPMLSYRDQDVVRIGRLQSIAGGRLSGRLAR